MGKYYIIEYNYVGVYQNTPSDMDTIQISKVPAVTNKTGEITTNGWCGTYGGTSIYAHGEYNTLVEARNAIDAIWGDVRDYHAGSFYPTYFEGTDIAKLYRPGKYNIWSDEDVDTWMFSDDGDLEERITPGTTDKEIEKIADEYEHAANDEINVTLRDQAIYLLQELRAAKIQEALS